ncbi:MAG: hypothetical protein EGP80_14620 [Blautia wexlerae]|nr:hypothetical protein [Blautia wexlerae]
MKRIGRILLCILMITVLFGISIMGNFVVKSENKSKEKKRTAITKEEMKEWAAPDEETLKYYDLGKFSTTLPVIYMNTKGQKILKENAIWGNIALLDRNEEAQSIFSVPNSIYRATIKYRGASSYSKFDKKQYRIEFYKNNKDSTKKVSLAGMGANSEWVLNGPYLDKTLIRNKLVYDLAGELNGWAPDTRFVELFVDGKYQGVYLAVEPVTNGESRLRLAEFGLLSGETAYVVNRDRIDTGTEEIETWGKTEGYTYNALYIRYPSKNKITKKQKEYIKNDISEFEQVLYGKNFSDKRIGYQAYIDMDNWVDYFIINEFAMNYDAGNLSTYVYKELGGKLQLAAWDFNNGFDNYQWFHTETDRLYTVENSWFDRLWQDESFKEHVCERYGQLRKTTLSDEHIAEKIASYQAELGAAVDRNFKVWGYSFDENLLVGTGKDGRSRDIGSYEEAMQQLTDTIRERLAYLDKELGEN